MFAIVEIAGKQCKVTPGDIIKVEKIDAVPGEEIVFDKVLLTADGEHVAIGAPYIAGASVKGKVRQQGRHKKIIVFRYASKTRRKTKKGHRQPFTEVEIIAVK